MRLLVAMAMLVAGCGDNTRAPAPDASERVDQFWSCRTRRACAGQPEINLAWISEKAPTESDAEAKLVSTCEADACDGALACEAHCCLRGDPCE